MAYLFIHKLNTPNKKSALGKKAMVVPPFALFSR